MKELAGAGKTINRFFRINNLYVKEDMISINEGLVKVRVIKVEEQVELQLLLESI